MAFSENEQLTAREHMLMEHEAEQARLIREYSLTVKQLELETVREKNRAAIELKRLEAKWGSWLRIPLIILKLPVSLLLGLGYIVSVICKREPPKDFWLFLK